MKHGLVFENDVIDFIFNDTLSFFCKRFKLRSNKNFLKILFGSFLFSILLSLRSLKYDVTSLQMSFSLLRFFSKIGFRTCANESYSSEDSLSVSVSVLVVSIARRLSLSFSFKLRSHNKDKLDIVLFGLTKISIHFKKL